MAIAVASTGGYTESGAAGTSHVLSSITTTAGNGIAVIISSHATALDAVASVTDSAGNVYHRAIEDVNSNSEIEVWITDGTSPTALSSGSITVTTASSVGVAFRYYEISGAVMPLRTDNLAGAHGSGTSVSPGAGAGSQTTDLILGAVAVGQAETFSSVTFTAGAGTDHKDSSTTTSSVAQLESSSKVLATAAAQTYTATVSPTGAWAGIGIRFLASGPTVAQAYDELLDLLLPASLGTADFTGQLIPPTWDATMPQSVR